MFLLTNAEVVLGALSRRPHFGFFPVGISVEFAIVHALDALTYLPLVAQQRMAFIRHR